MITQSNSIRKRNRRKLGVRLHELERRLMLAADAGAAVCVDSTSTTQVAKPISVEGTRQLTAPEIVFVDHAVENLEHLFSGLDSNADLVLLDAEKSGLEQITAALAGRSDVRAIHLIGHGEEGQIRLGNETIDEQQLVASQSKIAQWRSALTSDADVLLYSCETGKGLIGKSFIARLAEFSGADVAASTDLTGGANTLGDWDLEATVGKIDAQLAVSAQAREKYSETLDISIRAAGVTGEEQMNLVVAGNVVETWTVGGDAYAGIFETYTVDIDGVDIDDVRIEFTNDFFDEANGIDRNLRVDNVSVDGVVYETEAPTVFSTGTWLPGEGVTPGFDESEFLHSNGYFQFADTSQGTGTEIRIAARGDEGGEAMSLLIGGQTVQNWSVTDQQNVYTFRADSEVSADDIRIEFENDAFDEANGIDRNLIVDYIELDGVRYETEAPTTFSTGTWLPEDGVQPGFRQSETLHSNGYFQYASGNQTEGTEVRIAAQGTEGGESLTLLIDGEAVKNWVVSTDQQEYLLRFAGEITATNVQVRFDNDLFDEANGIDRNLIVDFIELDGERFETEAATTFSTGTWLPEDGVQPGFRQSETLHSDGYFQYAAAPTIEGPGVVEFLEDSLTVDENSGVVLATLVRNRGTDGELVVSYGTVSGTALAGEDYYESTGIVVFNEGETEKQIALTLRNGASNEPTERFVVELREEDPGSLGERTTLVVNIVDDDLESGSPDIATSARDWNVQPVHSMVLRDGRVLMFGVDQGSETSLGFRYGVWNPTTDAFDFIENSSGINLFANSFTISPINGNVVITGFDIDSPDPNPSVNAGLVYDLTSGVIRFPVESDFDFQQRATASLLITLFDVQPSFPEVIPDDLGPNEFFTEDDFQNPEFGV